MDTVGNRHAESPIVEADANTVEPTVPHGLEVKRRMRWLRPELCVAAASKRLHVSG
jgi:hypothetical protein